MDERERNTVTIAIILYLCYSSMAFPVKDDDSSLSISLVDEDNWDRIRGTVWLQVGLVDLSGGSMYICSAKWLGGGLPRRTICASGFVHLRIHRDTLVNCSWYAIVCGWINQSDNCQLLLYNVSACEVCGTNNTANATGLCPTVALHGRSKHEAFAEYHSCHFARASWPIIVWSALRRPERMWMYQEGKSRHWKCTCYTEDGGGHPAGAKFTSR